jgi:hypothetical protein
MSHRTACGTLPSKPRLDKDDRQKTDANGKLAYVPVLEWRSRDLEWRSWDLASRFSEALVALVLEAHPGELDEP